MLHKYNQLSDIPNYLLLDLYKSMVKYQHYDPECNEPKWFFLFDEVEEEIIKRMEQK